MYLFSDYLEAKDVVDQIIHTKKILPPFFCKIIKGEFDLKHQIIETSIDFKNCAFLDKVDLRYCECKQLVDFSNCIFEKEVDFGHAFDY